MQINVSGKHLEVTDPIKTHAIERAERLPRLFDRIQEINVLIDKSDNHQHEEVEVIVEVEKSSPFITKKSGPDLYVLIDDVFGKIERQLRDHKEKLRNRKHQVN
ncbi:MAG: ribosome hibernation-promoting factor, HPF/YfiA family [Phycisphaeraceae bacterium JB051]